MNYGIIGVGKVGKTLADFFYKKNQLLWVCDKVFSDLHFNKNYSGVNYFSNIEQINILPDVIFIAVEDSSIYHISVKLSEKFKFSLKGKIILHTSGILTHLALESCKQYGALIAKAHPYQTFSKGNDKLLEGIGWGIETDDSFGVFANIISGLKGNPINLSSLNVNINLYHASAVTSSNFLVTPIIFGKLLAEKAGINPSDFIPTIARTALETSLNFDGKKGALPLTGPIARGDIDTVKSHIEEISSDPQLSRIYSYLALATIEMAYYFNIINSKTKSELEKIILEKNIFVDYS